MNSFEPTKRRLHWVAALVVGLKALPQLIPLLILVVLSGRGDENRLWQIAIGFSLLPLSLVLGIVHWWRFQYWVDGGELRVKQGVFIRRNVYLPRERIQAIDVSAGVIQRLFGLVRVRVKSAAAGNQVELSAVSRLEADQLRAQLRQTQEQSSRSLCLPVRFGMTTGQLLLAASTSSQIGVILSGVLWLYAQVDDIVQQRLVAYLQSVESSTPMDGTNPALLALFVAGGLVFAWTLSIVDAVIRFGHFSVERRGSNLIVRRGLLEHREVSIAVDRVQVVRIVESLPRQPLGYGALFVESAGHAEERGKSTVLHPCLPRTSWIAFLQALLPQFAVEPSMNRPPKRAFLRFLFRPVVSTLFVATSATLFLPFGWVALALPVGAALLAILAYRDTALGRKHGVAVLRFRRVSRHTAIVPRSNIQFVSATTSWFQKRRRVASIEIGAAAGAAGRRFEARELDAATAKAFLAWCSSKAKRPSSALGQIFDAVSAGDDRF